MCRYHFKLLPWASVALCLLLLALLPMVISFRFLALRQVGTIGEVVIGLAGILLLPPLAFREDHEGRREALGCRPVAYWRGFAVRLALMSVVVALCVGAYIGMAALHANPFDEGAVFVGLWVTATVLGGMGLAIGHGTRSQTAAFLLPTAYFALELFTKGRYTGRFFLLSLMEGELRPEKWVLGGMGVAVLLVNVALSGRQVRVGGP